MNPPESVADPVVLVDRDAAGVTSLTLNRPAQRNALSEAMLQALKSTLAELAADPAVRVLVLAGAGPAFCAGHDLKELRALPDEAAAGALFGLCGEVMLALRRFPHPVIAQVHGVATAAGCQLVASCDLAIASDHARFATPGVNIGLFCSTPAVALTRNVAYKHAMEMLFTGELIDAATALRFGLVNRVVPTGELEARTRELAVHIASRPAAVLSLGKAAVQAQLGLDEAAAYAQMGAVMAKNLLMAEAAEGIDAFLEKRPPNW
ncbi:enoyl-CoA hydratase [Immundisolibacter sp.]|uniref:enoyl-CoA hydratase n=1 Tax=Immundisolibacter sp. TaxID=1934948 RepID=UPI00260F871C|nr:enoyl-CoA hydratase [Immundisolibacter sp.]MDD3651303.1 enoyl-CoA hydratase [Immundisolibacter sp.]